MKRSTLLGLAVLMALIPSWAFAHKLSDPEADTGGKLDIVKIRYARPLPEQARLRVDTATNWKCRYLNMQRPASLRWFLDGGADGDFDMIGRFFCEDGDLFFRLRETQGQQVNDTYPATRPTRHSAKVQITLQYQQLEGEKLGMLVKSKDNYECTEPCKDRAPDRGRWVKNR